MILHAHFTGETTTIASGLALLSEELNIQETEKGLPIEVERAPEGAPSQISFDGKKGRISCSSKSSFFRALTLWLRHYQNGRPFVMEEQPQFKKTGVMVDSSRNAVISVTGMKQLLREMAKLGLNQVMLYTEDTYEVKEYPYFGYLRGRYTQEEMKEMDDYADALGIEMVPCIQTLGHLYLALKYEYANKLKDTEDIVLVGEPETYGFLENLIRSATQPFRSNRIHIGMDEAFGLGMGVYRQRNGIRNSFEIMNEHLKEIVAITDKLGLEPMMWSDMYYRFGSKTGDYYDLDSTIPADIIEGIPEVDMVLWDYYHEEEETYDILLRKHKEMKKKVIFAGGVWTWNGIAPNYGKSFETTKAALASCKKNSITEVFATLWGDDGGETPILSALPGLQMFADLSYQDKLDETQMAYAFEHNTGYKWDEFLYLNEFDETPGVMENNLNVSAASKFLLWQDPLLGLYDQTIEGLELGEHYHQLAGKLKKLTEAGGKYALLFVFYHKLAEVLSVKAEMGIRLKKAYDEKDRDLLTAEWVKAQELKQELDDLRVAHRNVWMEYNKPFGWEVLDIRYGGTIARMSTTIDCIKAYLDGETDRLEELEEEKLAHSTPYPLGEGTLGRGLYKDMITAGKLSGV